MAFQLKALGVEFVREFTYHPTRKWRFDFALVNTKIAVEVEGGAFNGGHRRGAEFNKDCERSNAAQLLGWTVLRFSPYMVETGEAIETIETALAPTTRGEPK